MRERCRGALLVEERAGPGAFMKYLPPGPAQRGRPRTDRRVSDAGASVLTCAHAGVVALPQREAERGRFSCVRDPGKLDLTAFLRARKRSHPPATASPERDQPGTEYTDEFFIRSATMVSVGELLCSPAAGVMVL